MPRRKPPVIADALLDRLLDGADAIKTSEERIAAIAAQPADDYPIPSNNHVKIEGR